MPNYDMRCAKCDITFVDVLLTYDEAKTIECPTCNSILSIVPSRFCFEVTGSRVKERQMLEARFNRRSKHIDKNLTTAEKDNFDKFCRKHNLRRYY